MKRCIGGYCTVLPSGAYIRIRNWASPPSKRVWKGASAYLWLKRPGRRISFHSPTVLGAIRKVFRYLEEGVWS